MKAFRVIFIIVISMFLSVITVSCRIRKDDNKKIDSFMTQEKNKEFIRRNFVMIKDYETNSYINELIIRESVCIVYTEERKASDLLFIDVSKEFYVFLDNDEIILIKKEYISALTCKIRK